MELLVYFVNCHIRLITRKHHLLNVNAVEGINC